LASPLQRNIWDTVSNPGLLVSAGANTGSLSAVTFSDGNGVSFGLAAGVITASASGGGAGTGFTTATTAGTNIVGTLDSNGASLGVPAYLTTFSNDQTSGRAGTGFTSATTAGTNIVGTLNTDGLSVGVPAYLTTYSNDLTSGRAGTGFTSSTTAGTAVVGTLNTNGLSMGVPAYLTTYANDLTSGRAGTGFTSATTAGTVVVGTLDTNGLSVGVPAYLTTYANDLTSGRAGTGFTSTTTAGTAVVGTLNTNGLSVGVPAYLTTYANDLTSGRAGTGFTSTTTAGTAVVGTLNTNGLSVGVPAFLTTYVNDLTSGRAGTGFTSTTTAGTAIVGTLNTSGLSIGVPAFITTYVNDLTSGRAGTGFTSTTTAGTAIVGTLNTNGLSVGVPAFLTAAVGGGGVAISNSQTLFTSGTVALSEGGGAITIASSAGGQSLMFSVPQTSSLAGASGIAISTTGSTISIYAATAYLTTAALSSNAMSYFENMPILDAASTTLSASGSVLQVVPFVLPHNISIGFLRVPVSMSYVSTEVSGTTANSTWTVNRSYTFAGAIFTQLAGASSLSLGYLTSSQATWVFQNQIQAGNTGSRYTVTQNVSYPISGTTSNYTTSYPQSSANVQISSASLTLFTGARWLDIPMGVSLSAGNYWLALGQSTNSATQAGNAALGGASAGFSFIGVSQNNLSIGFPGAVTNSSIQLQPGLGSWSTNAAVMSSSSLQLASISAMASGPKPYFQLIRYA